jgi:hypothetical protein
VVSYTCTANKQVSRPRNPQPHRNCSTCIGPKRDQTLSHYAHSNCDVQQSRPRPVIGSRGLPSAHARQRHGPDDHDGGFTRHAASLPFPAIMPRCISLIGAHPNCDVQQKVVLPVLHAYPSSWDQARTLGNVLWMPRCPSRKPFRSFVIWSGDLSDSGQGVAARQ